MEDLPLEKAVFVLVLLVIVLKIVLVFVNVVPGFFPLILKVQLISLLVILFGPQGFLLRGKGVLHELRQPISHVGDLFEESFLSQN